MLPSGVERCNWICKRLAAVGGKCNLDKIPSVGRCSVRRHPVGLVINGLFLVDL